VPGSAALPPSARFAWGEPGQAFNATAPLILR
jgi:hypothetical protein